MINTQLSLASDSRKISLKLGNSIGKLIGILTIKETQFVTFSQTIPETYILIHGLLLVSGFGRCTITRRCIHWYITKKHIPITIIVLFKNEKSSSSCCRFVTRHVIVLEIRLLLAWYFFYLCAHNFWDVISLCYFCVMEVGNLGHEILDFGHALFQNFLLGVILHSTTTISK